VCDGRLVKALHRLNGSGAARLAAGGDCYRGSLVAAQLWKLEYTLVFES